MEPQNDDLLLALMNKIEQVLTGGDAAVPPSSESYIAWCRPGIPFQREDLEFAVKGISDSDATVARKLIRNAAEFSRVVNAIPSKSVGGKNTYEQNGKMAWDIYGNVLNLSQVPDLELAQEEKDKIADYRKLLVTTKTTKDLLGRSKEVTEDSDPVKAYKEKKAAYDNAVLEYNNRRLAAMNGDDGGAVSYFALNGEVLRSKVKAAEDEWNSNGYKNDIDDVNAYIKETTQRSMSILKHELADKFERGKMTDPNSNLPFYLSGFYPGDFINSDAGWTKLTFSAANKASYSKDTHSDTSGSAGGNWGLWSASGSGSTTEDTATKKLDETDFSMEFSLVQVSLGRPWMSPEFLTSTSWKWAPGVSQDALSNGPDKTGGQMPAYPTTAVFVKDVKITSSAMSSFYNEVNKSTSTEGSAGWGPFSIKVHHNDSSKEVTSTLANNGKTLIINGMQLIAFKCFQLPVSPNPDPNQTSWV